MTDKPKHKHTPSRRRKFLLWIIVPIVALIVGFMAVSPQIDAWLATDPFTPQCHFEEDRYFYVWTSLGESTERAGVIVNANGNKYWQITEAYPHAWSPDGQLFAYIAYDGALSALQILDLQTGDQKNMNLPGYHNTFNDVFTWSPDSKYLAIQADAKGEVAPLIIVDRNLDNVTRHFSNVTDIHAVHWSPDSQKIVVVQASATHDIPDVMLDILTDEMWGMTNIPDYFSFVSWRNEREILFNSAPLQIFKYGLADQTSSLWIDGIIPSDYHSMSIDKSFAIVESGKEHTLYHLSESNRPIQVPEPPFFPSEFLGNKLYSGDSENSYFYDLEIDYSLTIPRTEDDFDWRWIELSPSNNYISYEVGPAPFIDIGILDINTLQELEHPYPTIPLPEWVELDGQEWLTYIVQLDTKSPMINLYLYNPNNHHRCIAYTFKVDMIYFQSWQPKQYE